MIDADDAKAEFKALKHLVRNEGYPHYDMVSGKKYNSNLYTNLLKLAPTAFFIEIGNPW